MQATIMPNQISKKLIRPIRPRCLVKSGSALYFTVAVILQIITAMVLRVLDRLFFQRVLEVAYWGVFNTHAMPKLSMIVTVTFLRTGSCKPQSVGNGSIKMERSRIMLMPTVA